MTESAKCRAQGEISSKRETIVSEYPGRWREMIREWRAPRTSDAVWLTYSANYLFNTGGLKWAVDPVLLSNRVPEAQVLDAGQDLGDLDFVLLTHAHADHVDTTLRSQLKASRCHWIVPEHMTELVADGGSLSGSDYTVAVPGKDISVTGARISPFNSPHYERRAGGDVSHVDSTGYCVETSCGQFLLPGDIRTYDPACLSPFADVSAVFAHVFLGRSAALVGEPPLLDEFVAFYLSCRPKKIVLSHLYEFGREPEDCWVASHAQAAALAFATADSKVDLLVPEWYREIIL